MKKNFSELKAGLVKRLMPEWCIMQGILRTKQNAYLYQLGSDKELEWIERLLLSNEQLEERLWTYQTVVELMKKGRSCFKLITTMEQLQAVPYSNRIPALRVFWEKNTPSQEYIKRFLQDESFPLCEEFMMKYNSSMSFLKLTDLISQGYAEEWVKAEKLAELNACIAKNFAKTFFCSEEHVFRTKRSSKLFDFLMIALKGGADISYAYKEIYQAGKWYDFVLEELKQQRYTAVNYLVPLMAEDKKEDSLKRLFKTLMQFERNEIYMQLVIQFLPKLHKLSPEFAVEKIEELHLHSMDACHIGNAYPYATDAQKKQMLTYLVDRLGKGDLQGVLLPYFPFKNLNAEYKEKAFVALIAGKKFPSGRISELSAAEKEFVIQKLEEQAQLFALSGKDLAKMVEQKLHPQAEVFFFKVENVSALQTAYINKFDICEEVFEEIIKLAGMKALIIAKATKWRLSEEQYLKLLQSKYNVLAADLKGFVKKA